MAGVEADRREVTVRFNDAIDPRHLKLNGTEVECHLHDEEALARARELQGD